MDYCLTGGTTSWLLSEDPRQYRDELVDAGTNSSQTSIPERYHEDMNTLLRLSGTECGLSCSASASRVSLHDASLLSYLRVSVTTRAAAFNTRCSLWLSDVSRTDVIKRCDLSNGPISSDLE